MKQFVLFAIITASFFSCGKSDDKDPAAPSGITAPPASLGLNSFYKKYIDADGIPVISSENVADQALLNAKAIVVEMIKTIPAVKAKMIENHIRVAVICRN